MLTRACRTDHEWDKQWYPASEGKGPLQLVGVTVGDRLYDVGSLPTLLQRSSQQPAWWRDLSQRTPLSRSDVTHRPTACCETPNKEGAFILFFTSFTALIAFIRRSSWAAEGRGYTPLIFMLKPKHEINILAICFMPQFKFTLIGYVSIVPYIY